MPSGVVVSVEKPAGSRSLTSSSQAAAPRGKAQRASHQNAQVLPMISSFLYCNTSLARAAAIMRSASSWRSRRSWTMSFAFRSTARTYPSWSR